MDSFGWLQAGECAFYAFTTATVLFMILYGTLSPWWRTPTGRNIMTLMSSLGVAGVYFSWAYERGGPLPEGFYPVRFVIFFALFLAVSWRVVLFTREQILVRRENRSSAKGNQHDLENVR